VKRLVAKRGSTRPKRAVADPICVDDVINLGAAALTASPPRIAEPTDPDIAVDEIKSDDDAVGPIGGYNAPAADSGLPIAATGGALDAIESLRPDHKIVIEIDPHVSAGFISQRYDLEFRGWVVGTTPAEEVTLIHENAVVGQLLYGRAGPNAQVVLLDGTTVTRQVFTLTLPRPRSAAGGQCSVSIAARTIGGQSHSETYSLLVDPLLPTHVRVTAGPTRSSADYGGELAPVVLFVERAARDTNGNLQLSGWAVSLAALVTIQTYAGDELIGSPKLGLRRDDVAGVFPAYPTALNAGFTLSTVLSETARDATMLRVQAICSDGFAHEVVVPLELVARLTPPPQPAVDEPRNMIAPVTGALALSPSRDPRRIIHHYCDIASLSMDGAVIVDGWAVCAIGIAKIEVWLDDHRLGEAELGLPREDVGGAYRSNPMARYSGFRFTTRVDQPAEGEHRLRVILRNGLEDVTEDVSHHVIERPKPVPVVEPVEEFRFEIDTPSLANGVVVEPITGRLTIEGWLLSRSGVAEMQVWLDDQRLGEAHHGLARQDVGNAFPDWPNSLRSGYAFHCPPRSLRNGAHVVKITARTINGASMEHSFHIDVRKPEGSDDTGGVRRRMNLVEVDVLTEALARLDYHPEFHLVLRQNGPIEPAALERTLISLECQAYRDWQLVALAEDEESAALVSAGLLAHPSIAGRVTVIDASAADAPLDVPFGSGAVIDDRSALGGPCLCGLLCPGDELGCDALIEIALAGGQSRVGGASGADFLYADEIRISPVSREPEAFCKPEFSPDLLLSTNYIGRPWFATPEVLARAEVTPRALLRDAEYDIVLRCTDQATAIRRLAKLLCRRGGEMLDSPNAARAALRRAAARRGIRAEVQETTVPGTFRFRRLKRASGKVSIIIPTCAAHGHIETCIRTLRDQTTYRNFEIICVDNIPARQVGRKRWLRGNADKIVAMPEVFNWSRFNNRAVEAADGEYLLFLNDDVEIIEAGWLDAMLEHVQRPEVGIVGAQLMYPGGKVQHAGMFLATTGTARHAFRFATMEEPGYFGLALTQRNVIAVTGACLLVRREVFDAVGRFDEAHEIINNDLDFCLRAHKAGLLTVYTPYARLIHHELASRDKMEDVFDIGHFARQWKTLFAAGDPYFSPLLSRHADDYRPDDEPVEQIFAGYPLFHRADIKRILVLKLDHIGDFITALPAIRRLKQQFPAATIDVLAARGARDFAEAESCIDGFIEFDFFHARSGLGQKELTEEDYAALRARLVPRGFDLAIDLRKHLDTREVLRHIPARFLAGYDYMGQFTFLDIALEWEGDRHLHRKRSHVTDDLVNLVDAVSEAADEDRTRLSSPVWPEARLPAFLDDASRALFARPVVAIHPGVGTVMRQWPAEHFAALVDLLIDAEGVNAVLVGGPDEIALAQEVLDKIVRRDAVVSLTGRTTLAELTALLACCALYVGNNSGPKHIAAAMGVPTIGIHSGVVDPVEWAPIGKRAMALRRDMTCGPCYLARLEDCPRNLACLRQLEPANVWQACRTMLATSQMPVYADAVGLVQQAADLVVIETVSADAAVDIIAAADADTAVGVDTLLGVDTLVGEGDFAAAMAAAIAGEFAVASETTPASANDADAKVVPTFVPTQEAPPKEPLTKEPRKRRKRAATRLPDAPMQPGTAEPLSVATDQSASADQPGSIATAAPVATSDADLADVATPDADTSPGPSTAPNPGFTPTATTGSDTSVQQDVARVSSTTPDEPVSAEAAAPPEPRDASTTVRRDVDASIELSETAGDPLPGPKPPKARRERQRRRA